MEHLLEQCEHNQTDEACEECTPKVEREDDIFEYDYNKRIWF